MKNRHTVVAVLVLSILFLALLGSAVLAPDVMTRVTPSLPILLVSLIGGAIFVGIYCIIDWFRSTNRKSDSQPALYSTIARGVSQMFGAVMLCDPSERIIWVNEAFSAMTGYSLEEVIGRLPGLLLQGKHTDPEMKTAIREQIYKGEPFTGEILNYKKDGTAFWIYLEIRQIRNDRGEIEALFSSQTDITERKQYETQRERQLEEALAAADIDPLTGLLNHRAFQNQLNAQSILAKQQGSRLGVLLIDLANFKFFNEAYGHLVGDQVLKQVTETLVSSSIGFGFECIARFGGDEFAMLIPELDSADKEVGPGEIESLFNHLGYRPPGYDRPIPITVSAAIAVYPDDGKQISDVLSAADTRLLRAKTGGIESPIASELRQKIGENGDGFTMLDALVTAVDNKDRYTRRHSEDVLDYALNIADFLGLDNDAKNVLAIAALLHDVGKIGVPDRILRKPGPLTDEEFDAVKKHPQMGAVIVGAVNGFEETLDAIMYHHERWDGRGYPIGLGAENIPRLARIMAVADGYSAMTTDRPYRQGMTRAEAFSILKAGAGAQWDPEIVDALVKCYYANAA